MNKVVALGGASMRVEIKTGSSRGIALKGISLGQKIFSTVIACVVTLLLIIIPNIL